MIFQENINILLIEDEEFDANRVKNTLKIFDDKLVIKKIFSDGRSALDELRKNKLLYEVVIMDYQIIGALSGEALIKKIKEIVPEIQIIVITKKTVNITDFEFANRLIEAGAMWYCTKYPANISQYIYQPTDFILSIINAYEKRKLEIEKRKSFSKLKLSVDEILAGKQIIGESEAIKKMMRQIEKAARQEATVLIYGASGTGKELVATHIHYLSARKYEKFVRVNSGSLPKDLIESELFGYEKGAFTGASGSKIGLFEAADNGSLFLDEIGELPPSAQVKLLRVLQEGEIDKIGRTSSIRVNVRIIAATNKDLFQEMKNKRFREDLFYRLNVITIRVPLLKERKMDIPRLVRFFLAKYVDEMSLEAPLVSENAMRFLVDYDWPGNVRQLQNVLQRALFLADRRIEAEDIQNALGGAFEEAEQDLSYDGINWENYNSLSWREMERGLKKSYFKFIRNKTASDTEAARKLGLAPSNYYRACKDLGLK